MCDNEKADTLRCPPMLPCANCERLSEALKKAQRFIWRNYYDDTDPEYIELNKDICNALGIEWEEQ